MSPEPDPEIITVSPVPVVQLHTANEAAFDFICPQRSTHIHEAAEQDRQRRVKFSGMRAPHIGHIGARRKTHSCCLAANRASFRCRTSLLYIEGAHITRQGANFLTATQSQKQIIGCLIKKYCQWKGLTEPIYVPFLSKFSFFIRSETKGNRGARRSTYSVRMNYQRE